MVLPLQLFRLQSLSVQNTNIYIGPFAGSGHMVRNKLHWDANDAVGLPKQRNSYQSSPTFLCFGTPTASFASQCNLFRTMWPDLAKGLLQPLKWDKGANARKQTKAAGREKQVGKRKRGSLKWTRKHWRENDYGDFRNRTCFTLPLDNKSDILMLIEITFDW